MRAGAPGRTWLRALDAARAGCRAISLESRGSCRPTFAAAARSRPAVGAADSRQSHDGWCNNQYTEVTSILRFCLSFALLLVALAAAAKIPPLVDVTAVAPGIQVRLSYATADNAFHHRLYAANTARLRAPVAARLGRVQRRLARQGYGLLIWDAYRPQSVQLRMWRLRPDARSRYLANPRKISKHSRGAAVDVTLVTADGAAVEMPTPHDEFSPRAHRSAQKGVSTAARKHRETLSAAMRAEGFVPNPYEWWHFTAPDWSRYPASDVP